MKQEITITADTNDGDYVTQVSEISENDLSTIKPLIASIKRFKKYKGYSASGMPYTHHHNYPFGDCAREDLGEKTLSELYDFDEEVFELFNDYIPYGEYGIHTIKSITICPLQEKTRLL